MPIILLTRHNLSVGGTTHKMEVFKIINCYQRVVLYQS